LRYYIADLHFFHGALNSHMDRRGFETVEAMNEAMVQRWNRKVRKNDEVVIIGDLSWGNEAQTNELLRNLNGKLYLIQGNHDHVVLKIDVDRSRFQWIKPYEELHDNNRKVILCHYPIMFYNGQYQLDKKGNPRTYMLYGHVHDTRDQRLMELFQQITRRTAVTDVQGNERLIPCNMINCFCMYSDYEPLSLDEWIRCDRKRREGTDRISLPPGVPDTEGEIRRGLQKASWTEPSVPPDGTGREPVQEAGRPENVRTC